MIITNKKEVIFNTNIWMTDSYGCLTVHLQLLEIDQI